MLSCIVTVGRHLVRTIPGTAFPASPFAFSSRIFAKSLASPAYEISAGNSFVSPPYAKTGGWTSLKNVGAPTFLIFPLIFRSFLALSAVEGSSPRSGVPRIPHRHECKNAGPVEASGAQKTRIPIGSGQVPASATQTKSGLGEPSPYMLRNGTLAARARMRSAAWNWLADGR